MKNLLFIFFYLFSSLQLNAQWLSITAVDTSNFPVMKAKFWAFDSLGKQQQPSSNELALFENGVSKNITDVSCPVAPVKSLSVCFMVDVFKENIQVARTGIQRFTKFLNQGKDGMGITTLKNVPEIHCDYTTDLSIAATDAASIPAATYTATQEMFYHPVTGGVPFISNRNSDKKVLILITDLQFQSYDVDTVQLYKDAAAQNISVYTILIGSGDYTGLFKRISERTGGKVFTVISTFTEITDVFKEIERREHNTPCNIAWQSKGRCQSDFSIELKWKNQSSKSDFYFPTAGIEYLQVSPAFVDFRDKPWMATQDTTITLTALNADFVVNGISHMFGSSDFSMVNTSFPLTIPKSTSKNITLRFNPTDSTINYTSFEISTDKCTSYLGGGSGYRQRRFRNSTLKLIAPNGREIFGTGSEIPITWDSISKTDNVVLEYSIDNGVTWDSITYSASNLQYLWQSIPKPVSNFCKVRVKQLFGTEKYRKPGTPQFSFETSVLYGYTISWSPDGTKIAASYDDSTVIVWSTINGLELFRVFGYSRTSYTGRWSPDGTKIATAGKDKKIHVWSTVDGTLLYTFTGGAVDITWSPDGTRIAVIGEHSDYFESEYRSEYVVTIWSVTSGSKLFTLYGFPNAINHLNWSPDGTKIATAGGEIVPVGNDYNVVVWSAENGLRLFVLRHNAGITDLKWSPDGTKILTASEGSFYYGIIWSAISGKELFTLDKKQYDYHSTRTADWSQDGLKVATAGVDTIARIWSVTTGQELFTLKGHKDIIRSITWSPDGTKIATTSSDSIVNVWSAATAKLLFTIKNYFNIAHLAWSPDGSRISTTSVYGKVAKIWFVDDNSLQEDESDSVFSIDGPKTVIKNPFIDMGKVLIGEEKDSTVNAAICNHGSTKLHVLDVLVSSGDTNDIAIPPGSLDFFLAPNECRDIAFKFKPAKIGNRSAKATIRTTVGNLKDTITIIGEGITLSPLLAVVNASIDFGKIQVGTIKDSLQVATIMNIGSTDLIITKTDYDSSNLNDFSTISSETTFTLKPNSIAEMDLRFEPKTIGKKRGQLQLHYNDLGSPVIIRLFGEGVLSTGINENRDVKEVTIIAKATSLSTRPNPAQNSMQIQYGLREPLTVTLELLDITGQVVQTIVSNQSQAAGQYTLMNDMSLLGNGVYSLRLTTNKDVLTSRVDVVK